MPPAKTGSSEALSKGDHLEARVAQLWFWEGYFARRGIDLRHHYHPEPLVVTDLDLLAYEFSPTLHRAKIIGEVKSGTGKSAPKPLDRIVWLRGLLALVGADHAELTSSNPPSPRARDLARTLGVRAQSENDVERRELGARVADVANLGAHGPQAFSEQKAVHAHCSKNKDLERAYWFLRSEVWFLDEVTAAKRLIGLYRQLSTRWTPDIDDDDARSLRWLFAEAVSVFTLNVVTIAADALTDDDSLFGARVGERLSAGFASADAMRRISADVDKYIGGVLVAANAPAAIRSEVIGALHPQAPEWTEQFLDLLRRIAAVPSVARDLPRQVDLLVFERLTRRRHVPEVAVRRIGLDHPESGRLIRLIAAFLRSQAAAVAAVDKALTTPVDVPTPGAAAAAPTETNQQGRLLDE